MPRARAWRRPRRGRPGPGRRPRPCRPAAASAGRAGGQHVDGGAHRVGVGVVAVVHQRDRAPASRTDSTCRARPSTGGRPPARCATASGGAPAASAQAAAASALLHVVRPAMAAWCRMRPSGGVCSAAPVVALPAAWPARRPPPSSAKQRTRRAPASSRHSGAWRRRPGRRPCRRRQRGDDAPFSRATASTPVHELLVLALRVVDQRHRGRAPARQHLDLARVVHAELDHRHAVQARAQAQQRQRHADVVVQVALRWPGAASPSQARRMAAIICVTVVLPLLPVTAISGSCSERRQPRPAAAARPGCRPPAGPAGRPRQAALGQRRRRAGGAACGRKSWASKRSPRSATNRSPGCSVRVSLCTRCSAWRRRRQRGAAGQQRVRLGQRHHAATPRRPRAHSAARPRRHRRRGA
jgi:hypothetical protein